MSLKTIWEMLSFNHLFSFQFYIMVFTCGIFVIQLIKLIKMRKSKKDKNDKDDSQKWLD